MNIFRRFTVAMFATAFVVGLAGPAAVFAAATDPGLGAAASFSVIAQTGITGVATISGDVGINSTGAGITAITAANVGGSIYSTDGVAPSVASPFYASTGAQPDLSTAFTATIPGQTTDGSIGPTLDGLVVVPGVWDIGAGRLNGGVLTLNGPGIYIFRASSDFISSGSVVLTNGARACDVYWNVTTLATINGTSFVGTILAGTGVHFDTSGTTLNGRALAVGGNVTFINNIISGPTCAAATPSAPVAGVSGTFLAHAKTGIITVVKTVIGATGGTLADFPLFVSSTPMVSGQYQFFPAPATYAVTEAPNSKYTAVFSGDCDATGHVILNPGESKFCLITNTAVLSAPVLPPLIEVVKVPSPLSLPNGPGMVTYTYTVRNVGPVPMSDVKLVGDTCSPINLVSGDTNADSILALNETWVFRCSVRLASSHTNTVVATGWANGISATDIATAHVIVGLPIVPPLIHVTKVPAPLALNVGGGMVTYTEKVTNPGTVALSNVHLTDDKCSPMKFISGDLNGDQKLDTNETWTYTCSVRLSKTTLNTATAEGTANNITIRDFALATVVVPLPKLPNTGFAPLENNSLWSILMFAGSLVFASASFVLLQKRKV